jgi:hypothetical protein
VGKVKDRRREATRRYMSWWLGANEAFGRVWRVLLWARLSLEKLNLR